jgi:protein involved in polysaccharide export with SLBB domain
MKKRTQSILLFLFFFTSILVAQDLSQLKNIDINELSDEQVSSYWESIQEKGYTLDQAGVLAKAQGISLYKFAEFKRRVQNLPLTKTTIPNGVKDSEVLNENNPFGLDGKNVIKDGDLKKELLFGYDFFNNPKISFTPNINLAIPKNYQLGPADEMVIDLWGAAEISYNVQINKQGAIKIEGVGYVYVSGMTIEAASKKINSRLKKKHAGIGAVNSSYNKIYTNISITKTRTVQVNIIGEIKVPGTYSLSSLSTVLNALYAAGGPTKQGTFRVVKLIRDGKNIATFDVYKFLLIGSEEGNLKIQDQDIIIVGPYKNIVSIEGAVKRPGKYELLEGETLSNLIQFFGGFSSDAYTDLLVVERVNGSQREVKEVELEKATDFLIKAGDKFLIQKVVDKFLNRITVNGAVFRPGDYEFIEGMTLKRLIEKAEGVTDEAFLSRGLLVRSHDDTDKENIAFSVKEILSGKISIALKSKDEIRIFQKDELREKQTVLIQGAVNNPQKFDFVKNMQIEDLIALSGGLTEAGDRKNVNISRRLKDGSFTTLSKNFNISSISDLGINKGEPFYLEPFDIVNVRFIKGYISQQTISIKGEVLYQGNYVLSSKNERISDIIKRAGGLTPYAYIKGATLNRAGEQEGDAELLSTLKDINKKDSISSDNVELAGNILKIGIELAEIMKDGGRGSKYDLFLEEGDELIIPSEKQTIEVRGEVLLPSIVRYEKKASFKSYISNSGGLTEKSAKARIFVLYSNGVVKTVKNYFFFKVFPKLEPGAIVVVPAKVESKDKMSVTEILGITTSITTLGILIQNIK